MTSDDSWRATGAPPAAGDNSGETPKEKRKRLFIDEVTAWCRDQRLRKEQETPKLRALQPLQRLKVLRQMGLLSIPVYYRSRKATKQVDVGPFVMEVVVAMADDERTGGCTMSVGRIAAFIGCTEDAAREAIKRYVELGLLRVIERPGMSSIIVPNIPAFLIEASDQPLTWIIDAVAPLEDVKVRGRRRSSEQDSPPAYTPPLSTAPPSKQDPCQRQPPRLNPHSPPLQGGDDLSSYLADEGEEAESDNGAYATSFSCAKSAEQPCASEVQNLSPLRGPLSVSRLNNCSKDVAATIMTSDRVAAFHAIATWLPPGRDPAMTFGLPTIDDAANQLGGLLRAAAHRPGPDGMPLAPDVIEQAFDEALLATQQRLADPSAEPLRNPLRYLTRVFQQVVRAIALDRIADAAQAAQLVAVASATTSARIEAEFAKADADISIAGKRVAAFERATDDGAAIRQRVGDARVAAAGNPPGARRSQRDDLVPKTTVRASQVERLHERLRNGMAKTIEYDDLEMAVQSHYARMAVNGDGYQQPVDPKKLLDVLWRELAPQAFGDVVAQLGGRPVAKCPKGRPVEAPLLAMPQQLIDTVLAKYPLMADATIHGQDASAWAIAREFCARFSFGSEYRPPAFRESQGVERMFQIEDVDGLDFDQYGTGLQEAAEARLLAVFDRIAPSLEAEVARQRAQEAEEKRKWEERKRELDECSRRQREEALSQPRPAWFNGQPPGPQGSYGAPQVQAAPIAPHPSPGYFDEDEVPF